MREYFEIYNKLLNMEAVSTIVFIIGLCYALPMWLLTLLLGWFGFIPGFIIGWLSSFYSMAAIVNHHLKHKNKDD